MSMKDFKVQKMDLTQKLYNCGGIVVFNYNLNQVILVKSHAGHHSFPKGKREKRENLYQTAVRETEEETGLKEDQYVLSDFVLPEYKTPGSPNPSVLYFIGQVIKPVDTFNYDQTELDWVGWTSVEEALKMEDNIFAEKRRIVLKKAFELVNNDDFKFYPSSQIGNSASLPQYKKELTLEDLREKRLTGFSKTISWALRHKADQLGLDMDSEGYVLVDQLLGIEQLQNLNLEDLKTVVETNKKKRFSLLEKNSKLYIRANQGHSTNVGSKLDDSKMMKKLSPNDGIDKAYHGTTQANWILIEEEGLRSMNRKHVHLSLINQKDNGNDIAGIRGHSQVILEIDLKKALERGLTFYLSENNVVLTTDPIPRDLISLVKRGRKVNMSLI